MATAPAAAMLDPDGGRIVGYAAASGRRPARVDLLVDGLRVRSCIAAAPATVLGAAGFARLGPPPDAGCAFELRLPPGDAGARIAVESDGRSILSVDNAPAAALRPYREGAVMTDGVTVENIWLDSGVVRARLIDHAGRSAPGVTLRLRGETIGEAALTPEGEGRYQLSAPLDPAVLSDGVAVLELALGDGSVAGRLPIAAGAALAGDLAAEVASLRAELDQLKRTFRAEIAGGVIRRDERPMIVAEALTQVDHLLEMRDRADRRHQALRGDDIWEEEDPVWDVDQ